MVAKVIQDGEPTRWMNLRPVEPSASLLAVKHVNHGRQYKWTRK